MFEVFLPLLFAALMGAVVWAGPSGTDEDEAQPPDNDGGDDADRDAERTSFLQDQTFFVLPGASGSIAVPDAAQSVEISAETEDELYFEPPFSFLLEPAGAPMNPLIIEGNDTAETYLLSGSGYEVNTGGGGDLVRIAAASNLIVTAGDGDTVEGPDLADGITAEDARTLYVSLTGNGTYIGGDAGLGYVVATGTGNTVTGGPGAESVISFGAATIDTGAGDDVINTTATLSQFMPTAQDSLSFYINPAPNQIDAGAGDDQIWASHNDTITGGPGADDITLFISPRVTPEAAPVITDFDPQEDAILIYYGGFVNFDLEDVSLVGDVSIREEGDDTLIQGRDGGTIATLQAVTSLRVGLWTPVPDSPDGSGGTFTDLDGTPVPRETLDVIVTKYQETMT